MYHYLDNQVANLYGILFNVRVFLPVWHYNITEPPMVTTVSDLNLNEKVEKDLSMCTDLSMNDSATRQYYHTLKNRLSILREYIPANFSTEFKNPCWFDFHQKPTSPLIQTPPECYAISSFYSETLAQQVVEQVKKSGEKHLYCLPAFYLIGFPKSATTTLYKMIIKHPLIADTKCPIKESQFWSMFMNKHGTALEKKTQILHYLNYFSQSVKKVDSNPESKLLDGSVSYLTWTTWTTAPYITDSESCLLPSLFRRVLPEAKFIVIMRNPTERTFSHFYFFSVIRAQKVMDSRNINHTKVSESFHKHTVQVITKFQSCVHCGHSVSHCVREKSIDGSVTSLDGYVGIQTSLYYYHIVPWLSIIPRKRFLFLRTEDLAYAPQLTMTKVWDFFNFPHLQDGVRTYENVNRRVDGVTILPQTKKLLDDFFRPYNQLLAKLLSDMRYLWND